MSIESLDTSVKLETPERIILPLESTETQTERFVIPYPYKFNNGSDVNFVCKLIQDSIVKTDTFKIQLYRYTVKNIDIENNLSNNWTNDNWNSIDDKSIKRNILTDSPGGNYTDKSDNYIIYNNPIQLTGVNATLEFNAHWNIERHYDACKIEASSDDGANWINLRSSKMRMGLGLTGSRQDSGKYSFDGFCPDYVRQECDLSEFLNKSIVLRFGILSDERLNFDGVFIDNLKIRLYEDLTGVEDNSGIAHESVTKIDCFPSPVKIGELLNIKINSLYIEFSNTTELKLYNSLGEEISSNSISNSNRLNNYYISTSSFQPGIYFVRIINGSENYYSKIIAIR
ncbi:MAG: immune inhibitor A [Ignavibacteriae bacterium]|nr:immune inhibitor A [Ignavibacteriota bacterium]